MSCRAAVQARPTQAKRSRSGLTCKASADQTQSRRQVRQRLSDASTGTVPQQMQCRNELQATSCLAFGCYMLCMTI